MTPPHAARRRVLPGSPFPAPPPVVPASERLSNDDLVTHDRLGVGTVVRILDDVNVLVAFRGQASQVAVPHHKLTRL